MDSNKIPQGRKGHKLSLFDLGTKMVHIEASDRTVFIVHRKLLDYYGYHWDRNLNLELGKDEKGDLTNWKDEYRNKYQYRGFVHWLYHQELPSNSIIQQSDYPEHWVEGKENEPLACSMAFELYNFAWNMRIGKLEDDIMTYLFDQYMAQDITPSLGRVSYIFEEGNVSMAFVKFCTDIYCKLNSEDLDLDHMHMQHTIYKDMDAYPKTFLFAMFQRQTLTNFQKRQSVQTTQSAASSISSTDLEDMDSASTLSVDVQPWSMRFRDYHEHMKVVGGWNPDVDRCECSTKEEHYIIE